VEEMDPWLELLHVRFVYHVGWLGPAAPVKGRR
jgi:hypothetical protein